MKLSLEKKTILLGALSILLKAISTSCLDHVQLDGSQLVYVGASNYAIGLEQDGYVWKTVSFNANQVTIIDALCDETRLTRANTNQDDVLESFLRLSIVLHSLHDPNRLAYIGYENKYFMRASYDDEAKLVDFHEYNKGSPRGQGLSKIHAFELPPFVNTNRARNTKLFANNSIIALVDANGIIRMKPLHCLTQDKITQISKLLHKNRLHNRGFVESSFGSNAGSMAAVREENRSGGGGGNEEEEDEDEDHPAATNSAPGSPANNANPLSFDQAAPEQEDEQMDESADSDLELFQSVFGLVEDGRELATPDETLARLHDLVVMNRQNFVQNDDYQAKLMLEATQPDASKCNQDKFRQWSQWFDSSDFMSSRSNLRSFLFHYGNLQMLTCIEVLHSSVKLHSKQLPFQLRQILFQFMREFNTQPNEDRPATGGPSGTSDDSHPIFEIIQLKSLYNLLINFVKSKDVNLDPQMRRAQADERKIVLMNSIEKTLGAQCQVVDQLLVDDLKFFDFLRSNQWLATDLVLQDELSDEVADLLYITRICQLIDLRTLDQNRLVWAYGHRSSFSRSLSGLTRAE